jgi:hypothetical protein
MEEFIDQLLGKNPDGLSVNVVVDGAPYSGAIRATEYDGLYEMKVISPQTRQPVSIFVSAPHVSSLLVVTDEMAQSVERPSGLIVPRSS